jgi:hypothetical protein
MSTMFYLSRFQHCCPRESLLHKKFCLFDITIQCCHVCCTVGLCYWVAIHWTFEVKGTMTHCTKYQHFYSYQNPAWCITRYTYQQADQGLDQSILARGWRMRWDLAVLMIRRSFLAVQPLAWACSLNQTYTQYSLNIIHNYLFPFG